MKVLYSNQPAFDGKDTAIFLAGPTPRSQDVPSWRPEAIEILRSIAFEGTVLVPEWDTAMTRVAYEDQVEWERAGLAQANIIVFWVPRNMTNMPALTTNVEFGYWLAKSPERVIYGRPTGAPSTRYLDWLLQLEKAGTAFRQAKLPGILPGQFEPADNLFSLLETAVSLTRKS